MKKLSSRSHDIIVATYDNDIKSVKRIINENIYIDTDTLNHVLNIAVKNSNYSIARLLLKNGANPNVKEFVYEPIGEHWTALYHAVYNDFDDIVELLLEYGADVNAIDGHNRLLYYSAKNNYTNVIKKLLMTNNLWSFIETHWINHTPYISNHISEAIHTAQENVFTETVQLLKNFIIEQMPLPMPDDIIINIFTKY